MEEDPAEAGEYCPRMALRIAPSVVAAVAGLGVLVALAHAQAVSQEWIFQIQFSPSELNCRTCSDRDGANAPHPTGECLQFELGCPGAAVTENNQGACIGSCVETDDDDYGSNDFIIGPPPPSPNPSVSPTAAPTGSPVLPPTISPTLPAETFSPTYASNAPTNSPSTLQPTGSPSPPPPPACSVEQSCNCENVRINPSAGTGRINITCLGGGFTEANDTATQILENVTVGDCSLSYTETFNYTDVSGNEVSQEITVCYGDGNQVTPPGEETCENNTAVIVIIVICVILLLVFIGLGVYMILREGDPKAKGIAA